MILKIAIGAVCLGIVLLVYCCCRAAGAADAELETMEAGIREDGSGDP